MVPIEQLICPTHTDPKTHQKPSMMALVIPFISIAFVFISFSRGEYDLPCGNIESVMAICVLLVPVQRKFHGSFRQF